jgi:4-amino-4-deoxy-L-arabinose transferase-like glycosyltransferase
MDHILGYIKKNWVLVLILLIGAFLRLYRIGEYMTFLGDEGRDAIIVRNLLVHADPILIGPGTSVGGMYLGPLYYYFMAPFLVMSNFSPIGPAIGVALLGVATIYLGYLSGLEVCGQYRGWVGSGLCALSRRVIIYSHSSWNPNIMPFFALLSIYSIWRVWKKKEYNWLIAAAISFAFVLQSHYLGVLLGPVLLVYYCLSVYELRVESYKNKNRQLITRNLITRSLIALFTFLFLMSPLLAFDIRHDWMNSRAFYKFVTVRQETVSIRPWTAIPKSYPIFEQINASMLTAKNEPAGQIVTVLIIASILFILIKRKENILHSTYYMLLLWLITGLIGFGIYKQHIYDHYFGFMFAIPFLLLGVFVEDRIKLKNKTVNIFIILGILYLILINLKASPLLQTPNNQMKRSENVANKVIELSGGDKFNIAVVAERNYEGGYQYFLEKNKAKIVEIDAQIPDTITKQLYVICEMDKSKCNPTNSPKAQVASFGWSKIDSEYEVDGVIIYKLIHSK